jgi:hypothetical protein
MQLIQTVLKPLVWRWLGLLLLPLVLGGCLHYDLTLRFDHRTHGQISQTIALSERGAALAQPTLAPWLEELKVRSRPLGGQLSQSPQTVTLVVPFGTAADLSDRFQELFTTAEDSTQAVDANLPLSSSGLAHRLQLPGWGMVPFELAIDQANWLLASRTHLTYTLDLQDLPTNETNSAANSWADLHFRLQVPWGLAAMAPTSTPPIAKDATGATWLLQPGRITHIEVAFWLPNALAIGTLGIVALVLAGYGLRYRVFKLKP